MAKQSYRSSSRGLDFGHRTSGPSISWKLMVLVGMLAFVLILMQLAGNPSNWRWMGLNEPPPEAKESSAPSAPSQAEFQMSHDASGKPLDPAGDAPSDPSALELDDLTPEISRLQDDFWTRLVRRLDGPSRQTLYKMIQDSRAPASPEDQTARANVVERIEQFNNQYATDLLAQSGELQFSDPARKQLWYDLLFQWQKVWSEKTKPLLSQLSRADEQAPPGGLAELQQVLSGVAKSLVLDEAPMGRPLELPYWNELVSRVRAGESERAQAEKISFLELRAQPAQHRGKLVEVTGRIRGARVQKSSGELNGIDQYFELWVQPEEGSTVPWCVFALEMPTDFPAVGQELVTMDIPMRLAGYFFKTRSYLTSERQTQFTPTVLAKRPAISAATTAAAKPPKQPWAALGPMMAIIVLIAAWIAFRVYRSTIWLARRDPPNIDAALTQLADDPNVESVAERLAKWQPREDAAPISNDEKRTAE